MSTKERFSFDISNRPHQLLDKTRVVSAPDLFSSFPHSRILVLDFAIGDGQKESGFIFDKQGRFLATQYDYGSRVLLNIDHHNDQASKTENFSTTHQVISAVDEGQLDPVNQDQIALVNHDDADSILSLLLSTHGEVPSSINEMFAEAAKAADHTGESHRLVNLVDSFYRSFDLTNLVPLINAMLYEEELQFPNDKTRAKFEKYEEQPRIITDYISSVLRNEPSPHGSGFYDQETKILGLSPHDKSIDTSRVLPITLKLNLPVSIIFTYAIADEATNWWKISLRSGAHFPMDLTLEEMARQLKLEQFGYGGRRNAGGMGRFRGERTISPPELLDLLRLYLLDQKKTQD